MKLKAIYPSSLLNTKLVDENFAAEAETLKEAPVRYSIEENKLYTNSEDLTGTTLLYRGWILSKEQYFNLEKLVQETGGKLLVNYNQYCNSQFADGWYKAVETYTAKSVILPYDSSIEELTEAAKTLGEGPYILKGSSKSLKHLWDTAMFVKDIEALESTVEAYKKEVPSREDDKLFIRNFENYCDEGELRLWFLGGRCNFIGSHPTALYTGDTTGAHHMARALENWLAGFDCPFYTVDVVQDTNGEWRVVELGSGSVSGSFALFSEVVKNTPLSELYNY